MYDSFACSCCSRPLLRHIRSAEIYWYCTHCHEEMPALTRILNDSLPTYRRRSVANLASTC